MITEIGIVAGEIWHYLDENGKVSMSSLISGITADEYLILMSLGWLAREGHVRIDGDANNVRDLKVFLSD